jgi:2,4-dienoyl-CoA reductase-like NADH-dependent reductase (Old Yellow Enzyme family)
MITKKSTRRDFLKSAIVSGGTLCVLPLGAAPLLAAGPSSTSSLPSPALSGGSIGSLRLPNRFIRAATLEGLAESDGAVSPALTNRMLELARGGAGLIITGNSFVSPHGQARSRQLAANDDRFIPGLSDLTSNVHANGSRIALQIVHSGCYADPKLTGVEPVGPSVFMRDGKPLNRAMSEEELMAIAADFASAALRGRKAGFDAVEIHACHGSLLSQFLSPFYNNREDEYGGSLENRARFLVETVRAARAALGPDFPLMVKINSEDSLEGGFTPAEAVIVSAMLEQAGVDAVELSGGTLASMGNHKPSPQGDLTPDHEAYYREAAQAYKRAVGIPLILVGGMRSFEVANSLVQGKVTDFISISRPFIREPGLVKRWVAGDLRRADCISCNGCLAQLDAGQGAFCVFVKRSDA